MQLGLIRIDIDIDDQVGGVRAELTGEVDLSNAEGVESALLEAIDSRTTRVWIDLRNVSYLDSAGLRVLFLLAERLRVAQTELEVTAPAGSAARLAIEVSGMAEICGLAEG